MILLTLLFVITSSTGESCFRCFPCFPNYARDLRISRNPRQRRHVDLSSDTVNPPYPRFLGQPTSSLVPNHVHFNAPSQSPTSRGKEYTSATVPRATLPNRLQSDFPECPICFELFESYYRCHKCFKYFCVHCMERWFLTANTCPCCREVQPGVHLFFHDRLHQLYTELLQRVAINLEMSSRLVENLDRNLNRWRKLGDADWV